MIETTGAIFLTIEYLTLVYDLFLWAIEGANSVLEAMQPLAIVVHLAFNSEISTITAALAFYPLSIIEKRAVRRTEGAPTMELVVFPGSFVDLSSWEEADP